MKHARRWIGVATLAAGLAAGGAWWAAGARAGAAAAAPAAAASAAAKPLQFAAHEVVRPEPRRLDETLEFSGPLVAPGTVVVRAKAAGPLLALGVAEGQRVQAGQVLGRLDLADLESRAAERRAQADSARATLAQAERTHASNEQLAQQRFISPVALDGSRAAVDSARAALAAADAAVQTQRVALRDAVLVAPIAGWVAKRHALPGEKLAAEQPVLTLVDLGTLELAASVPTHAVARLVPGQPVTVRAEGLDAPVDARIARIAPAADPGTRAVAVTIALPNPGERLRAGQYASARLLLADARERLTLPAAAVVRQGGQDHVWVVERGQLARRAVTLGRQDPAGGRVELLSGVAVDAQVLAARFDNLREGTPALVAGAAAPASGNDGRDAASALAAASAPAAR